MSIGYNIKVYRKRAKLTQVELASKANISRSYLGDLEGDRYNPSIDTLQSIAGVLGVDVAVLLDSTGIAPAASAPGKTEIHADDPEDALFFRIMKDAKESGISAHDMQLAIDFVKRARERDKKLGGKG